MVVLFQPGGDGFRVQNETNGTKKDVILKNKAEKLLKTHGWHQKTKLNKPENKAEKLLKTSNCGKNKPEL